MKIAQFVDEFVQGHKGIIGCYIAVMPNDGKYDLEIEISEGSIGSTFATGSSSLSHARDVADAIDVALGNAGIQVFQERHAWELFLSARP